MVQKCDISAFKRISNHVHISRRSGDIFYRFYQTRNKTSKFTSNPNVPHPKCLASHKVVSALSCPFSEFDSRSCSWLQSLEFATNIGSIRSLVWSPCAGGGIGKLC